MAAGGTILFSSVPLAQGVSANVTVTNSGTTPTTITSVGIASGGASSSYSISNLPPLPTTLQPGGSLTFTVTFAPTTSGLNSATILINSTALTLSGFGTGAPAISSYQLTGVSGQVQPLTQPAIGLTLGQAYPLDLTGVLSLNTSSSVFAADPSVQFATGGRTVTFTVPANTTSAIFSNGAKTVQFQSGTVAETINLFATFATTSGVAVISNTPSFNFTVPQVAPVLQSVQISAEGANGITLLVEGYSTSRSLTKLNFQFSSLSSSFSFPVSSFSLDVSAGSGFWYSSGASNSFGGEFAITYPFIISPPNGNLPLVGNISVSVTASNSLGASNTVSTQ